MWVTLAQADSSNPEAVPAVAVDSGDENGVSVSVNRLAAC